MATPATVRAALVGALHLDLLGPDPTDPSHAPYAEALPQVPSKWYLTGFLDPRGAKPDERSDDEPDEHERTKTVAARRAFFPSSMGLSVLVPANVDSCDT